MLTFIDLRTGGTLSGDFRSVLCLGNFDGVHIGHSALIRRTLELKAQKSKEDSGILGGAWCFRQPPADFLSEASVPHICTLDEKLELFVTKGLDIAVLGDFTELRDLSPSAFSKEILYEKCHCRGVVCGFNFRFGAKGQGTPESLSDFFGDACAVVPAVSMNGKNVSSSAIREAVSRGDVESAEQMLGRPYSVSLTVEHGKKLGRKLGIPTVNQYFPSGRLRPLDGVYASYTELDRKIYPSVSNVGLNPTVYDGGKVRCETHIIGYCGDLYGRTVKVSFCKYLRGEQKFADIDELSAAMKRDTRIAEEYIRTKYKI